MIDTPKELIKAYKDYHDYLKTKIYAPDGCSVRAVGADRWDESATLHIKD